MGNTNTRIPVAQQQEYEYGNPISVAQRLRPLESPSRAPGGTPRAAPPQKNKNKEQKSEKVRKGFIIIVDIVAAWCAPPRCFPWGARFFLFNLLYSMA